MRLQSARYPVWLCDVWGVIHNGVRSFPEACDALLQHRTGGGTVLLITNAPRLAVAVEAQLARLGVSRDCFDAIITSGDVTRSLIRARGGGKVYHLGPPRDRGLFEGLDVSLVPLAEARAVVCTGLFDDTRETPDDYAETYQEMAARDLPMICANPDKVVRRGDSLVYCAGALAERYADLGGEVFMAGKPHLPIYELAMDVAGRLRGTKIGADMCLAIGDGPETDIAGAASLGIDCVLITGGISDVSLSSEQVAESVRKQVPSARIVAVQSELAW
jgi:HAD superfamily hydrolase (TIGR01459 family)